MRARAGAQHPCGEQITIHKEKIHRGQGALGRVRVSPVHLRQRVLTPLAEQGGDVCQAVFRLLQRARPRLTRPRVMRPRQRPAVAVRAWS